MICYLLTILIGFALLAPIPSHASTKDAIVKVFTTSVTYNYDSPWQASGSVESTGSGCIISDQHILTNAHVVSDARYIEIQKNGDPRRFLAKVFVVSHDADLALLQVEDTSFFEGIVPLEIGVLPELLDEVVVYGFPEGGNGLSVTRGVTSRIEVTKYAHSFMNVLGVQIDAAINSGNSGGPVIMDGKIVGVAMQTKKDATNIGYVIPVPIIEHFLTDLQDGRYDGFPCNGFNTQPLENKTLRKTIKIPDAETGVYIYKVTPGGPADGLIKTGDVILNVDAHPIANDGSALLRPGLRVQYDYFFNKRQIGETAAITLWRDEQKITISMPLTEKRGAECPIKLPQYDSPPEYYILAGILLTPLTYDYLTTWGGDDVKRAPTRLLKYFYSPRTIANEQVVIINGFLSSEMTAGYQDIAIDKRVVSVNRQPFANFREMITLIDLALTKDNPITLGLEDNVIVVVSPVEHKKNEQNLLELYGINSSKRVNEVKTMPR